MYKQTMKSMHRRIRGCRYGRDWLHGSWEYIYLYNICISSSMCTQYNTMA